MGVLTIKLFLIAIFYIVEIDAEDLTAVISEGENLGYIVWQLSSSSLNQSVVPYTLTGDFTDEFAYDEKTGNIYLSGRLDYERHSQYTITATESSPNINSSGTPIIIHVTVRDVNDNAPVFKQSPLNTTMRYDDKIGQVVMAVEATDKDSGDNGRISYSILSNSDVPPSQSGDRFEIGSNTGMVKLASYLDGSTNQYRFTVVASDNGIPIQQTEAEVTVNLVSSNKYPPKIESLANVTVSELTQPGTILDNSMITATDEDHGVDKTVYFEIIDGNTDDTFEIRSVPSNYSTIGVVKLLKSLDYESGLTNYALRIKAYNKDSTNYRDDTFSSTATMSIVVTDANEPPIFLDAPYSSVITEGSALETEIPLINVLAEDLDFSGNQTITYSLSEAENRFAIHPQTGQITHTGAVDREAPSVVDGVYQFEVIATDDYEPPGVATARVAILVNDINDNPPKVIWDQNGANVTICDKPENDTVKIITAVDPDSIENGPKFFYDFTATVNKSLWGFREVNDTTQAVVAKFTNYGLTSQSQTIELPFTITDSGSVPQTGTVTLTVNVCKCNNHGEAKCNNDRRIIASYPIVLTMTTIFFTNLLLL